MTPPLRILYLVAHPDDGEVYGGGTAALWVQAGHAVKFVCLTNGDAGHHRMAGKELAARRKQEAAVAAQRLGVTYEILDNPDGQLEPTLLHRHGVIRKIREWHADVVVTHRPNDYHPDHRYTSILVQDAAYLVMVPALVPDALPLRRPPVFLYFADHFQKPLPFTPDIAVAIDAVYDQKMEALHAHTSQFYEWLPWIDGQLDSVPSTDTARRAWLQEQWTHPIDAPTRTSLKRWYGAVAGMAVQHAEAFEVSEYGYQPDENEIKRLFPMIGYATQ